MPLTVLDPKTALIVIDLQVGIVGMATAHPTALVVEKARLVADAFRAKALPVVLVNVDAGAPGRTDQGAAMGAMPANWADLVPELGQQPTDHLVTKRTWGAFTNTDLLEYLKGKGVTQVVILGIATSFGVESTARFAYELGFNVSLILDAMTDRTMEGHENSVTRIFPRIGETGTTAELLSLLRS